MNAFKDSDAQVFVFGTGVAAAGTDAGAFVVWSPAGSAEAPVPPDGAADAGVPEDVADGFFAVPDGEAAEPAAAGPGWQAVIRRVAADMVATASAAPRTRGPECVPYCMKSPD
ncbi:hypothetical protein ACFYXJ_03395 [Streptomyces sp. NPDC002667]|uniref:hypothetical protein n=1 Tax=Streptomyces sp. NPDC002667 TaxID=3364657 RepID=UPI00367BA0FE